MAMLSYVGLIVLQLLFVGRAILRRHRDPASRLAWVVVILLIPFAGIGAYILFGETSIGRHADVRQRRIRDAMPKLALPAPGDAEPDLADCPERFAHLFRLGRTINGFAPVTGNTAALMTDSNAAIDAMVADMDAAEDHIHLLFYIWLTDANGLKIADALARAASRGVTCRAVADALGSRAMIRSKHWKAMREAGVRVSAAMPIRSRLIKPFSGRLDLRNHRKIVVIDGEITYCGSQNLADPEFLVKAKYAPWVDVMVRFEGPIARQNQYVFVGDWMTYVDENILDVLERPMPEPRPGFPAQVIATGPTVRYSAMPEVFETLLFSARREVIITTPYFVPDESMHGALCAAAFRGVETTIVFPARNDSWIVSAASRSYYADLLAAGVRIREYEGGLLHAKTLTVDGEVTLVGSANMDRRSFDLNYENNILLVDKDFTGRMRVRQDDYLNDSRTVTAEAVAAWPLPRRLWNNTIGMVGPLL